MSHIVVYMTDLHGNRDALERGLALAEEVRAKSVIIGGDLFPKTVAIVLKEKESDEEAADDDDNLDAPEAAAEDVARGGEVIPVHLLTEDEWSGTYFRSIEAIRAVNAMPPGPGALAQRLEREGAMLWYCRNSFYEMESLVGGEKVFDLLHTAFGSTVGTAADIIRAAQLTDFERGYILPEVTRILKRDVEPNLASNHRLVFARQVAYILGKDANEVEERDFDLVAPSRYFDAFIACACDPNELVRAETFGTSLLSSLESLRGDGGYVYEFLKHRIEAARQFVHDAMRVMGHCPVAFFHQAAQYTDLRVLVAQATSEEIIRDGQRAFFFGYFVPLLRRFRAEHPDITISLMLGNDDLADLEPEVKNVAAEGLFQYLHNEVHPLGEGWEVAGYAFVRPSPYKYKAWERPERVLLNDLTQLHATVRDPSRTVWVVHNPPWRSYLDRAQWKRDKLSHHVGSGAVRTFLRHGMGGALALFGHIHESPHVEGGAYKEVIGGTLCVNPGAEHVAHGLHAVVFDLADVAGTMRHTLFGQ